MVRIKRTVVTLAAILLVPMPVAAELIQIDITPSAGATWSMTGSFDYDAGTSTYANMSIFLTASIGPLNLLNQACQACPSGGSSTGLINPLLALNFLSDFTASWGDGRLTAIFRGGSMTLSEVNGRFDGQYVFRVARVPEPGSLALFALGLFAIRLASRGMRRA